MITKLFWVALAYYIGFMGLQGGYAQDDAPPTAGIVDIATPVEGDQLFGLVEIFGTASHPSLFGGYVLEWSNAQNPDVWLPIDEPVQQTVTDGLLGQWDTVSAGMPDGTYQIRLRVFLDDGSVQDAVVRNLSLTNAPPTELPTLPVVQATPTLPLLPTNPGDPTSEPLIQQPPTVTPRPTFEPPPSAPEPPSNTPLEELSDETGALIFNLDAVGDAVCNGVFFSFGLFGVIILYLIVRRQLSPYTRRLWWQIRSEIDNQQDY